MICAQLEPSRIEWLVLVDLAASPDQRAAASVLASVSRLGTVYPSAQAALALIKQIGIIPGWHEHWDRYFTYELRDVDGFGLPEQLVDLCPGPGRDAQAELGGAGGSRQQACVLGEVGAFVQAERQARFEGEEGDGSVGAGDLVVELLADDAFGLPAQAVGVEDHRLVEIGYRMGDEADLRSHSHLLSDGSAAGAWPVSIAIACLPPRQSGRTAGRLVVVA
jgi:hypothetical protein